MDYGPEDGSAERIGVAVTFWIPIWEVIGLHLGRDIHHFDTGVP
jgi:hypothetical protein